MPSKLLSDFDELIDAADAFTPQELARMIQSLLADMRDKTEYFYLDEQKLIIYSRVLELKLMNEE